MKFERVLAVRNNKTVYRDGTNVAKVFDQNYSKADILNEALNQARVEETGLHIPKINEITTEEGKWAIVAELIPGKTLARLMDENPDKMDEYMALFVDLQLEIHGKKVPLLGKLKDKMDRKIAQTDLDATTRYELNARLAGMPKHTKLLHGDFNPSNVIISDTDGLPYVIDWAHATQGNASADIARTYLLFCLVGNQALADQYLTQICNKADIAKQYVQQWMPIVAASQSVKSKPDEREFLLSWVNVVDYE